MGSDRTPEQSATRRIVVVALAITLVVAGFVAILHSVMGRSAKLPPAAQGGLAGLVPGAMDLVGERTPPPPPPPDLRETSEKLAEVSRSNWGKAGYLSPRDEEVDGASGETTLPFQGFGISVESEPEGARVMVNGREIGESPAIASVDCQPGSDVRIRIEKAPLAPQERLTRCRADKLVKLNFRLGRSPSQKKLSPSGARP